MKKLITTIRKGNQCVQVVEVSGMTGYEFDAIGKESLPLAVELALLQTQEPLKLKESLKSSIGVRSCSPS